MHTGHTYKRNKTFPPAKYSEKQQLKEWKITLHTDKFENHCNKQKKKKSGEGIIMKT